ncbi:hypothetical protein EJ04DRAFT_547794 [Polyplosphaeria fusca]|uniref:FHA domain-containing protein n=1 Tax=Polyplosphaeria fusca TaxID=682080 RepID=A0A9P4V9H5_9PLEO|nr:hypothetical protein EJ04DRAFT_547794 [Polyplosphaeria fusca]
MWFLEHESLFEGKRMWLKPGSQHLYGRTKAREGDGGNSVFIDSKSVSRQHMMLKVAQVQSGDGTKLHTRSHVEITDLSGRSGTFVGDHKLLNKDGDGGKLTLDNKKTSYEIKLGNSYPPFTLKWQPMVFTYASKENKEGKIRTAKLHALDIKTTSDFVYGQTTHVVSQKRNLPKVLQGLVCGTHIATEEFLDRIVKVATSACDAETYSPSKLEQEFDTWWPNESGFVPPVGPEPVPRPEQMLRPDPSRSEIFSGLSFVFLDENQYNNLQGVITGGTGKALLYNVQPGTTTMDEYVDFVKSVAGGKKTSKADTGRLPVVTIRLASYPPDMEEWATNFVNGVDLTLNQRSILQNEFLDAIVTNDTSPLQKPPPEIEISSTALPESTDVAPSGSIQKSPPSLGATPSSTVEPAMKDEPSKTIPRKRPLRRGATASRFTAFDDFEPPPKSRKIASETPIEDIQESIPVQASDVDVESGFGTHSSRQHRPSPQESVEETDQMDKLFPAAAALRQARLASHGPSASVEPETQTNTTKAKSKGAQMLEKLQKNAKKADKEINVREQTRQRIVEAERQRQEDEERLRELLEDVEISSIRGLALIEDMEVRQRSSRSNVQPQASDERWNPEWNGRKNFKKFKRRGAERGPQAHKVIVTLEETPAKQGISFGNAFSVEDTHKPRSKEDERRLKRRQGRGAKDDDSELEPGFTRRPKNKQREVINVEDSELDEDVMEVTQPGKGTAGTERVEETQVGDTQIQQGRKRPSTSVAAGQPASKRRTAQRDDDSDAEETGFRLARRRRGG